MLFRHKSPTQIFSELTCRDMNEQLSGADKSLLSLPARAHIAHCLRCQSTLASYRCLRTMLASLATTPRNLDPTLEQDILQLLDEVDQTTFKLLRQVAKASTAAAATIGGVAATIGVIALTKRQRRLPRLAI